MILWVEEEVFDDDLGSIITIRTEEGKLVSTAQPKTELG